MIIIYDSTSNINFDSDRIDNQRRIQFKLAISKMNKHNDRIEIPSLYLSSPETAFYADENLLCSLNPQSSFWILKNTLEMEQAFIHEKDKIIYPSRQNFQLSIENPKSKFESNETV